MMAAFEHGVTMEQYRKSPKLIAECFISSMDKYQYDGILVDIDTVTLAGAVGVPVDFHVDDPARSHLGLEYMLLTGADAFELDYKTNAQKVREIICSKACFIGNIDPSGVLTLGSTELVKQKTIDRVVNY